LANGKHASYFYAIFGITLVLFMLGVASVFIVEAQRISTNFKENLVVEVVLKDSINVADISAAQSTIKARPYVKSVKFISKDQAAKILQKDLGENFLDILGYNPLYASFNINLNHSFANKDSFALVKTDLSKLAIVQQVNIQNNILETMDKNVRSASFIILIVAIALLVFAVSLIFNTIRLVMFSKRFTIKTMQLFGATRWFIIRPILGRSILNGLVSGLVASVLLSGMLFYFDNKLPELALQTDLITFAALLGGIILFGILISFISTLVAVLRYLRLKVEYLY
jgi:cell division transport system permease protein